MLKKEYREIFCNDFKIPIKIYDSPLFEYYCDLLEKDYQIKEKLDLFLKTMEECGHSVENFKSQWHKIKKSVISDIESTSEYQEAIKTKDPYQTPYKVERGNPYNHAFKDVECISIDIISANFNSLRYINPNIVLNTKSFKELMDRYTQNPYYSQVKIFRQIIFESLGANKQQATQRKMMDTVLKELFKIKENMYLRMPSNDEIVIPLNNDQSSLGEQIEAMVKTHDLSSVLKLERFTVRHIEDDMFYKEFKDGKTVLRNVSGHYFSRAFKLVKGLPLTEEDNYFVFEGKLAKFVRSDEKT